MTYDPSLFSDLLFIIVYLSALEFLHVAGNFLLMRRVITRVQAHQTVNCFPLIRFFVESNHGTTALYILLCRIIYYSKFWDYLFRIKIAAEITFIAFCKCIHISLYITIKLKTILGIFDETVNRSGITFKRSIIELYF